jgi:hypothetical protein
MLIWHSHPVETSVLRHSKDYVCLCVPSNETDAVQVEMNATEPNSTAYESATTPAPVYNLWNWTQVLGEDCVTLTGKAVIGAGCLSKEECTAHGWALDGPACDDQGLTDHVPNVFLLSCFLFIGTFGIAYFLRVFRTMSIFPSIVSRLIRELLSTLNYCSSLYRCDQRSLTTPS